MPGRDNHAFEKAGTFGGDGVMLGSSSVDDPDRYLSAGKFGSSDCLEENCSILYEEIANIVSDRVGFHVPNPMRVGLIPVRMVLRRDLEFVFAEIAEGKSITRADALHKSADAAQESVAIDHTAVGPLTFLSDFHSDVWAEDVRVTFMNSMKGEGTRIFGLRPLSSQIELTLQALDWAQCVLPETIQGTLRLAPGVVVVRGQVSSAYINENPFGFFINCSQFADMPLLVETLFHESLHEKMARIRLTSNLLHAGYDDLNSETVGDVLVPWPNLEQPRSWSFARALAACHVYIHTSTYCLEILRQPLVLANSMVEELLLLTRAITQFERARYLHDALLDRRCIRYADINGEDFMKWTGRVIELIDPELQAMSDKAVSIQHWNVGEVRRIAGRAA